MWVKTVPPTATARLKIVLRVFQKVDTSIGPLFIRSDQRHTA
jgi:hypothetical protein